MIPLVWILGNHAFFLNKFKKKLFNAYSNEKEYAILLKSNWLKEASSY